MYNTGGLIRMTLVLLTVSAVFIAVKTVGEIKGFKNIGSDKPDQHIIAVSGKGEAFAVPDIATFNFTVREEALVVGEAQQLVTRKVDSAIEFLRAGGVEEKDIKTINYNIYPRYEYSKVACARLPCTRGKRSLAGYEVAQGISVKVRNISSAGKLLGGLGELGVSNISGLTFSVDDEEAVKTEARKKAIAQAKEKAKVLAGDLDVKLVRIVGFSESGNIAFPRFAAFAESAGEKAGASVPAPEVPAGENKIVSNVNITYEIR